MRLLVGIVIFCCWATVGAQDVGTQAAMHARVRALYSFSPHKLTDAQREAKSKEMDAFWDEVKAHAAGELPLLRVELADASNPAIFMEDGGALLTSLSDVPADKGLAVAAMARSDLKDVDSGAYFYRVHDLSMAGVDTTDAALHVLDEPGFKVEVPMHAMTLRAADCLVYLLLPVAEARWLEAAKARFEAAKRDEERKALLNLFFYSQTAGGDALVRAAASDVRLSEAVRKDAREYVQDTAKALKEKSEVEGTEAEVRAARRDRMGAVSDEAISDMQEMTLRLVQLRSRKR